MAVSATQTLTVGQWEIHFFSQKAKDPAKKQTRKRPLENLKLLSLWPQKSAWQPDFPCLNSLAERPKIVVVFLPRGAPKELPEPRSMWRVLFEAIRVGLEGNKKDINDFWCPAPSSTHAPCRRVIGGLPGADDATSIRMEPWERNRRVCYGIYVGGYQRHGFLNGAKWIESRFLPSFRGKPIIPRSLVEIQTTFGGEHPHMNKQGFINPGSTLWLNTWCGPSILSF